MVVSVIRIVRMIVFSRLVAICENRIHEWTRQKSCEADKYSRDYPNDQHEAACKILGTVGVHAEFPRAMRSKFGWEGKTSFWQSFLI